MFSVPRCFGLSLIEVMLALTLGLVLILGLYQILISNLAVYRQHTALGYLHENAYIATQLLSHDVRMAGLLGCSTLSKADRLINHTQILPPYIHLHPEGALQVYQAMDSSWQPALPGDLANNLVTGSDILIIQKINEHSASLAEPKYDWQNTVTLVPGAPVFRTGQAVMLADCRHAELFMTEQVSLRGGQQHITLNSANQINNLNYTSDAELSAWQVYAYYIGLSSFPTGTGGEIYSLFRKNLLNQDTDELVQGVRRMRIDLQDNRVMLNLLLDSIDPILDVPTGYWFNNEYIVPEDNRLYREWTVEVGTRNAE